MNLPIEAQLEALLFYKTDGASKKEIGNLLSLSSEQVGEAIHALREKLSSRGIVLVESGDTIALAVHEEMSSLIEKIATEEITKELSKASLETLSIILYKGGATRADIEFIRGVNASVILRNLSMRGLVVRESSSQGKYVATTDLLRHLGVTRVDELLEFGEVQEKLRGVEEGKKEISESGE